LNEFKLPEDPYGVVALVLLSTTSLVEAPFEETVLRNVFGPTDCMKGSETSFIVADIGRVCDTTTWRLWRFLRNRRKSKMAIIRRNSATTPATIPIVAPMLTVLLEKAGLGHRINDAEWKEATHDEPDEEIETPELMVYAEPEVSVESEDYQGRSEVAEEEESVGGLIDVEVKWKRGCKGMK
jgi:hypothetical protein